MFKVGDRVRCRNASKHGEGYLIYNEVYTVQAVTPYQVMLCEVVGVWDKTRFVTGDKVNPDKIEINSKAKPKTKGKTPANTYYVRRIGGGSPKVVHTTFEDSKNEANRLAELNPDAEFQVLAVAYTVKKVPVYTTEAQEYTL